MSNPQSTTLSLSRYRRPFICVDRVCLSVAIQSELNRVEDGGSLPIYRRSKDDVEEEKEAADSVPTEQVQAAYSYKTKTVIQSVVMFHNRI